MNACVGSSYCFYLFYSSFHNLYKVCKQHSLHAYCIYTMLPVLISFAICSYFMCCFMNLKCYLHQCLSGIILWYCSKVNTILTPKVLYTKVFCTLTHLYKSNSLECMHSLFFSSQPQIYFCPILDFSFPHMTKHAG